MSHYGGYISPYRRESSAERAQGARQAYDARIRRENQAQLATYQTQMKEQQDAANAANQKRYDDLLASVSNMSNSVLGEGGTFAQMQGLLENSGKAGAQRIKEGKTRQIAKSGQNLASRGLGNTTIVDSTRRGIESDAERNQQALSEQVATSKAGVLGQKAGFQQGIGNLMADSILSRQDVGPNQDMYAQLISNMFSA